MVVRCRNKATKKDLRTEAPFKSVSARQTRIKQPRCVSKLTQNRGCFLCLIVRGNEWRLLVGARQRITGCDRVLLVKEAWKFLFVAMIRAVLAAFSFEPGKFFSEGSVLA